MNIETEVLLIDDNPGDSELAADLLKRSDQCIHTHCVSDGVEAMEFLRCEGQYSAAFRPHLIMLDLNMPVKDGWAVLSEIKSDGALKAIPLVVFSTSQARTDIARCYELGANSYVTKPTNLEGFKVTVTGISDHWFGLASLVRGEGQ
jgi:two-component system, chemotaxis family, response regulator Rcp1